MNSNRHDNKNWEFRVTEHNKFKNSNNRNLDKGRRYKQSLISLRMIATRIGGFLIRSQDTGKNPSRETLLKIIKIFVPYSEFQQCINYKGLFLFVRK